MYAGESERAAPTVDFARETVGNRDRGGERDQTSRQPTYQRFFATRALAARTRRRHRSPRPEETEELKEEGGSRTRRGRGVEKNKAGYTAQDAPSMRTFHLRI